MSATPLTVMCTLALQGSIEHAHPVLQAAAGRTLSFSFAPTADLLSRIAAGERADILIASREAIDKLVVGGLLVESTRTDLAQSTIGVAVKVGQAHPDIGTKEAFVSTLLAARCVAYSKSGISGIYVGRLLEKLGIAEPVNARARIVDGGFAAECLVSGEADIAIQQLSELLIVRGIELVGELPNELQSTTTFSAAVFKGSSATSNAQTFLRAFREEHMVAVLRERGLKPCIID